eukprot:1888433-Pyramimonas_sp.AAC.1
MASEPLTSTSEPLTSTSEPKRRAQLNETRRREGVLFREESAALTDLKRAFVVIQGAMRVRVLGPDGGPYSVEIANVSAHPRDLNCIPGYTGDDRTLDKLMDGTNVTKDDRHMWLTPFDPEG